MLALALVLAGFYLTLLMPMRLTPDPELGPVALLVALGLLVGVVARRADPLMAPAAIAAGSLAALAFSLVFQSLVGQTSAMDPGAWRSALLLVLVVPPAVLASVIALVAVATRRTIRASVIGLAAALAITAGSVVVLGSFAAATDLTICGDEQVLTITLRDDAILFDPPQVDAGIVTIVNIDETTQPRSLEALGPIDEAELARLRAAVVAVPPEPGLVGHSAGRSRRNVCCRVPLLPGRNAWLAHGFIPSSATMPVAAVGTLDVGLAPEGFRTLEEDRLHGERFAIFGAVLLIHALGVFATCGAPYGRHAAPVADLARFAPCRVRPGPSARVGLAGIRIREESLLAVEQGRGRYPLPASDGASARPFLP